MNPESRGTECDPSPDPEKTKPNSKKVLNFLRLLLQTILDIPNLIVYKNSVNIAMEFWAKVCRTFIVPGFYICRVFIFSNLS